jgi:HAD superfamily hydrolase (TIGR01549 family)
MKSGHEERKVVMFDLWNTLAHIDSNQNPLFLLERFFGIKPEQYKKVERAFMLQKFPSVVEAAKHICDCMGKDPDPQMLNDLLDIYDKSKIHFEFFPDVIPELERLRVRGVKLALLSNSDCFTIKPFFDAGYKKYFDYIAFSYETGMLKPDSDIFRFVLEKLGAKPEQAVMVGDNLHDDVHAAEAAGMHAVLIRRDPKEFKFIPSWVEPGTYEKEIKNLRELEKFL